MVSLAIHTALVFSFVELPERDARTLALPGVVSVEIVSAPAPKKKAPAPPPPAPRAPPKKVLPAKPTARALKKAAPVAPPAPAQEDYDELMAQLRADAGEDTPAPPTRTAAALPGGGRPGVLAEPEVVDWVKRVLIHVRGSWVLPPNFRTLDLETHVLVKLDRDGTVRGKPKITKRSGNPWYDDGVLLAIEKASPLPRPPEAGEWPFVFRPEDSL